MQVKWYGLNALEFKGGEGVSFMIDPYVSRDREHLWHPEEVEGYFTSMPNAVLMTHAHWDHLADMPQLIAKTDTVLYASRTSCCIMRAMGVPERNLKEIHYGDVLTLPGGVKVTVIESRHMGFEEEAPGYTEPPSREALNIADNWLCGEVFAFLIEYQGKRILNIGSANFLESTMSGLTCDDFICGISRWVDGFPERLKKLISFKRLIPTHHDEFKLPLRQFILRNDLVRLKEAIPDLKAWELPVLEWVEL